MRGAFGTQNIPSSFRGEMRGEEGEEKEGRESQHRTRRKESRRVKQEGPKDRVAEGNMSMLPHSALFHALSAGTHPQGEIIS